MTKFRWICLIMFVVAGLMAACGSSSDSDPIEARQITDAPQATLPQVATVTPQPTHPEALPPTPAGPSPTPFLNPLPTPPPAAGPPLDSSGGFYYGPDARWPDYVPADIPVLEGEIDVLMEAPGSHIRMLYKNVSEEQILQYASVLEKAGFNVEGIVYVVPGFPDKSEEKLARGEFDALDITRGVYRMRLAYGAGEASYDIYTDAFLAAPERPTPTTVHVQWPDEIADLAPPPQNCPLTALVRLSPSGYQIRCAQAAESVVADYVAALKAHGFTEHNRLVNDHGELVNLTLAKGSEPLILRPLFTGDLVIEIRPGLEWPDDIAELAPPPQNCPFTSVVALSPTGYRISCIQAGAGATAAYADYIDVLKSLGFTEQNRLLDDQGELVNLTLGKGSDTITLAPLFTGDLAIEIRPSVKWPDAIADLAPPPERCTLTYVTERNLGAYHVACTREGDGVVAAYAAELTSWGFTEQTRVQDEAGEVTLLQLIKEDATVNLWPAPPDYLGIDIQPGGP